MKTRLLSIIFTVFALYSCTTGIQEKTTESTVVQISRDPGSLNPIEFLNSTNLMMINLLYQGLYKIDVTDYKLKPLLVESVAQGEQRGDTVVFNFKLRKEAQWPDGKVISAKDVAFSLKLLNCPLLNNVNSKPLFNSIRDIRYSDDSPEEFQLICIGEALPNSFLVGDFPIVPAHIFDRKEMLTEIPLSRFVNDDGSLRENQAVRGYANFFDGLSADPVNFMGSGPYQLESWIPDQSVKFSRKQNWWADALKSDDVVFAAQPQLIDFQVIPSEQTAVYALKNGTLDVLWSVPTDEFEQLKSNDQMQKDFHLLTNDTYRISYFGFNGRKSILDKKTRQALAHLIDKEKVIQLTMKGYAVPTLGFVHPQDPNYNSSISPYSLNPEKAQALLAEAGWAKSDDGWSRIVDGERETLRLNLSYEGVNEAYENTATIFASNAASIGIEVNLKPMERRTFFQSLRAHDFDMFIRSKTGGPMAYNFMQFLHSSAAVEGGSNYTAFGTQESDSVVHFLAYAYGGDKDKEHVLRFQEIVHEEANMIFLYFSQNRLAVSKRYQEPVTMMMYPYVDILSLRAN